MADDTVFHPHFPWSRLVGAQTLSSTYDTVSPFSSPQRALCPHNGLVYVLDSGNHRVQALAAADGVLKHEFGGRGAERGQLECPLDIALGCHALYVSDSGNQRVEAFSFDGKHLGTVARNDGSRGSVNRPTGLAVGRDRLFIADSNEHRVQCYALLPRDSTPLALRSVLAHSGVAKFVGSFCLPTAPTEPGLDWPHGVAVYGDELFVCDSGHHRISVWDARDGGFVRTLVEGKERCRAPYGVAACAESVFVTFCSSRWVREFPRHADAQAGSFPAPRRTFAMRQQNGVLAFVSADATGRLLVCDGGTHAVHAHVPPTARVRRWRVVARLVAVLVLAHKRACERLYAPGGGGYEAAANSFAAAVCASGGTAAYESGG